MFRARKEPVHSDWTDNLLQKTPGLVGSVGGAVAGGLIAGPAGIAPGLQIGSSLGNTIGGLIGEGGNSEAKLAKGIEGSMQGYKEWRQIPPEKKLDIDSAGKTGDALVKIPHITPTTEGNFTSPSSTNTGGMSLSSPDASSKSEMGLKLSQANDFGQKNGALTGYGSDLDEQSPPRFRSLRAPRYNVA